MLTPAENNSDRLNSEWTVLSAVRELMRIAMSGQPATYDQALGLGGIIVPSLLGEDVSLIRKARESDTAKEYRQKAKAKSLLNETSVAPLELLQSDIKEYTSLVSAKGNDEGTNQLKRRLARMKRAESELSLFRHTENQLIFRDVYNAERHLPVIHLGQGYKDFELPDGKQLIIRVLHPDHPEHISGADVIYERHNYRQKRVNLVAVQYKIWEDKVLHLSNERLKEQLRKLASFTCDNELCAAGLHDSQYRFPFCAGFLRPTDRLQSPGQELRSTGEHLPICKIEECTQKGSRGGDILHYNNIREISLSQQVFEELFSNGKIGSRSISYNELGELYKQFEVAEVADRIVIHTQEFPFEN